MNKERLNFLINNPLEINKEDNYKLEKILIEHPYFSIGHILFARGLLNNESFRYNSKLKKAAIYSIERKKLFYLISKENKKNSEFIEKSHENNKSSSLSIGKPLKFNIDEEYSFSEWLSITKIKKIDRSEKKTDIINDFLKKNPVIKIEKNKLFSPSEKAKISLIENDNFVTETLAKVYLEQKHFEKAIEAYQKLILKYPKKNSLFANQINLINKIKNT